MNYTIATGHKPKMLRRLKGAAQPSIYRDVFTSQIGYRFDLGASHDNGNQMIGVDGRRRGGRRSLRAAANRRATMIVQLGIISSNTAG
jgi:hypothetical protein